MAFDQADNPQEAVWSVAQKSESEEESKIITVKLWASGSQWCNNDYDLQENNSEGRFFGSLVHGSDHSILIRRVNKDLYHSKCKLGIPRSITFSLVQAITGDVVSLILLHTKIQFVIVCTHLQSNKTTVKVNVVCCHPGYHFENKTEVCEYNHNDTNIVRPGPNNRYLYVKVKLVIDHRNNSSLELDSLKILRCKGYILL